jgi:phage recombination protein Bet
MNAIVKTTAITTIANNLAIKLGMGEVGAELITTLKQTAFKGEASDAQFLALLVVANQYGLNPWTREIYAFPDKQNGIVPVVGVDGWSRIINENAQFDGLEFSMPDDGSECTCIIYRKDRAHPIKVTEYKDECYRKPFVKNGYEITGPWQSHPKRMLRHKAMIQCARLAFGYTGIFDEDEAQRIVEKDITKETEVVNKPVFYTNEEFLINEKEWKPKYLKGTKKGSTIEDFYAWAEARGKKLTDNQKNEIALWKQPEAIEGEATVFQNDFVAEMNAAESEGK